MASRPPLCAPTSRSEPSKDIQMTGVHEASQLCRDISSVIDSLKKQFSADRCILIKKKIEENKQKLHSITNHAYNQSEVRRSTAGSNNDTTTDLLTKRQEDALCMLNGLDLSNGEKDNCSSQEDSLQSSSTVLLGSSFGGKNIVRPIKLQEVQKLPPYTTWIFLDRNQRMTEDQSVVGRRRIYYDQTGGEALICSDSEEEVVEDEEEKKEFGDCEDYILRMAIQEVGSSDTVLDSLGLYFSRRPCEIKARYESLTREKTPRCIKKGGFEADMQIGDGFVDKDLDAALDSFDNLFCRRCLVFDCRLHGCSQDLVFPAEKQLPWSHSDEEKGIPCGIHCYRLALKSESVTAASSTVPDDFERKLIISSGSAGGQPSPRKKATGSTAGRRTKSHQSESASSNARVMSESSESEIRPRQDNASIHHSSSPSKVKFAGKCGVLKRNNKRVAERVLVCIRKRQKKMVASDSDSMSGCIWPRDMKLRSNSRKGSKDASSSERKVMKSPIARKSRRKELQLQDNHSSVFVEVHNEPLNEVTKDSPVKGYDETYRKEEFVDENICKHDHSGDKSWKTIEKGLFAKGVEIFGRNSCLIARNLLNGLRTCAEVSQYMNGTENKLSYRAGDGSNSLVEGSSKGNELRTRSRFLRRRGRVRRLKYTWKSAGYHSIRKRITERKDQPCRQYTPCSCQTACGKQCTCLLNGTCCEKYCGCPKSCKNRFRGCHCAKSQCRSRQCPCFAADRECDPDVCRNCWVGCGDGSLGGPSQRGDNYECRNMKLLLKQQQRVLLGRSDVSGWGAFLKNSVSKHEYLGEYTGELISHREADKRGKIYDRENSSFLFNLNDQFVLDAYRKGDKLKFANHSPDPNCYAKVMMVAGDHRVGIFAKERINAGEELFYDYRYEPDRAPAWARKPEASGSKKDDTLPSSGRAKKLA
ncbi:histone-lysine N-methyltransferase CLF isoform X2 [Magnolia sinica]|uniref:histone-lysine N-methyltransferase CLF isoform X2 n=1 Tax=Magnolia sinica TaxID=86752 RepID=UPI002657D1D4|nr:histone-lysine N-methyltransferase CLF isoform X2 [Magnolia sinica]